ncbi:SLC26A/SulP transporter [Artemisia annua]|uniref:SLC26A/SulP transporter n=1 Tax=Artemisia annua TaxID=35608 RepID=A0A2U1QDW1_ARTAN|nr:SLC26A/SulP transporter [Artemisia annua]
MEGKLDESHHHRVEIAMEIHKVETPPKRSSLQKLKNRLKETFFPDDPLRQFKGQSIRQKWLLGFQYIFPILQWGPQYNLNLFKSDVVSGLTIASLAIPQGISYAKLANLPPIWSWQTILMGSSFLIFLLVTRHISIKKPKLFWVSAGAPLLSVILSTLIIFVFKAQKHGISVIGKLEQGLNPPSWNMLHFHGSHIGLVLKTGLITGIISLTEGIAVGRTFAAIKNYQVDGNKEMIAIGVMNVVGSTTSCYITTGAFSRSAVNHNAGAKTAVSNIVMAVTVMVTLLFLMPLFRYTPNLVLGAIIVTAVVGLIDLPAAYQIWKVDKFDFVVMLCAFFGVIFISVQEGLALAVGISIFKMVLQMTRPKTVVLGNIPGTDIFRNKHQYKDAVSIPGFLILSIQAPINFANSNYLNDRIMRWILDYEDEEDTKSHSSLRYVLLDLAAVSAIDTNGVTFFQELRRVLEKRGVELVLVNPVGEVMEKLQNAGGTDNLLQPNMLYLTVGEAVSSLFSSMKRVDISQD